jgi:hypothetical protein
MYKLWTFLSGKKTAVGAVVSLLTNYLQAKGWIGETEMILLVGLATLFTGVGLGHKAVKHVQDKQSIPRV